MSGESDSSDEQHSPIRIPLNQYFPMQAPMRDIHGNKGNFLALKWITPLYPELIELNNTFFLGY